MQRPPLSSHKIRNEELKCVAETCRSAGMQRHQQRTPTLSMYRILKQVCNLIQGGKRRFAVARDAAVAGLELACYKRLRDLKL